MSDRNGFGILLVFVAIILLIIFASGAGQSFFSSQVISHTHRAGIGNTCRYLAESVCEEAFFRLEQNVNNPSSEIFTLFRDKVFGRGPAPFDIPLTDFPHSEALLSSLPPVHKYSIDEVTARVLFRRQITGISYEVLGSIEISALVTSDFYSGLKRRCEVVRDFKMALVSLPRPFCKAGLFIGSSMGFLHGEPNKDIRACYINIRSTWNFFNKALEKARDEGSEYPEVITELEEALKEIEDTAGEMLVGPADMDADPKPEPDKAIPHYFGDAKAQGDALITSPEQLMIMSSSPEIDLASIDLLNILEPLEKAAIEASDKYNKKVDEFKEKAEQAEIDDVDEMIEEFKEVRELSVKYVGSAVLVLNEYYKFQALLSEKSGESFNVWKSFALRKLRLAEWKAKAFYTLSSFDDMTELVNATGGALSGIVYIDSSDPIHISGFTHKGKLIIVTPGDLTIDSARVSDPNLDILTFVTFGNVSLDGEIDASVILGVNGEQRPEFHCGGSLNLKGSLIASEGISFPRGSLSGFVHYNEKANSGDTGVNEKRTHYFVAVSPQIRCRSARRE